MHRILTLLNRLQTGVAGVLLVMMVVLTTANILARQAGIPIRGTFEIMGFLGAAVFGLSLSFSHSKKEHLYVSILFDRFPKKVRQAAKGINTIACIGLFSLLSYQLVKTGLNLKRVEEVSETLRIPYYPVVLVVAFGVAVLVLLFVHELFTGFGEES
ncbi:MAG: TRAP transporter small permease [Desulfobacteraceae bacterium]|nr:TRAP transporter small permease [Desulfobacteraceae bacterium]